MTPTIEELNAAIDKEIYPAERCGDASIHNNEYRAIVKVSPWGPLALVAFKEKHKADLSPEDHAMFLLKQNIDAASSLCSDCPPHQYPTDETRCAACPRRGKSQFYAAKRVL